MTEYYGLNYFKALKCAGKLNQQRQRKRHLKLNIWEMVTILGLFSFRRILYCWVNTLQMDGRSAFEANIENEKSAVGCLRRCDLADYVKQLN